MIQTLGQRVEGSPTRTVLTPDYTRKTPAFIFPSINPNAPVFEDEFGFQMESGGRQGIRLSLQSTPKPASMTVKASQPAAGEDVYTFCLRALWAWRQE